MKKFEMLKNILGEGNYTTLTKTNKKEVYAGLCNITHSDRVIDVKHFGENKHNEILRYFIYGDEIHSLHASGSTNASNSCKLTKASVSTCAIEGFGFSDSLSRPVQVKRNIKKHKDGRITLKVYVKDLMDRGFRIHRKITSTPIVPADQ
jgi:hypothetical protein